MTAFHSAGTERRSTMYHYDVWKDGKRRIWTCYADSIREAEENAKTVCRLFGAGYLGNISEGRECRL